MSTAGEQPSVGRESFASEKEAQRAYLLAGRVFLPNTAVSTRELFSGRKRQITLVLDSINQTGLHAVIFGERGVGKTSLANIVQPLLEVLQEDAEDKTIVVKVNSHASDSFSEAWRRAFGELTVAIPRMGFKPTNGHANLADACFGDAEISIDDVRRSLSDMGESVFVFDEFDRMPDRGRHAFTDLIKTLSDFAIPSTIVLVGVASTIDLLIADHESITRAITQVPMPRMASDELRSILTTGSQKLGMTFDESAAQLIVKMSQGLPHYTHLVGQHSVRAACNRMSCFVTDDDVTDSLQEVVARARQSVTTKFANAIRSAHKDALYDKVLLACAITASRSIDELGYFQPASVVGPLKAIMPDKEVQIATFSNHLSDFCEAKRGPVLERTGQKRNYRYRFIDPLLPPFVIINGLFAGTVDNATVTRFVKILEHRASNGQMQLF